ncbi:MAG TPA: hypothetical protein VLA10_04725 [Ilumatobacter sp.]|nr:hypothetical protein [Ilumatobacter sp.]
MSSSLTSEPPPSASAISGTLTTPNGTLHEFSPPRLDILTRPDQLSLPRI